MIWLTSRYSRACLFTKATWSDRNINVCPPGAETYIAAGHTLVKHSCAKLGTWVEHYFAPQWRASSKVVVAARNTGSMMSVSGDTVVIRRNPAAYPHIASVAANFPRVPWSLSDDGTQCSRTRQ